MCWQADDDSNADLTVLETAVLPIRPSACGWHGTVESNHDLERQRLTSYQLNEHRIAGSAQWIRTTIFAVKARRPAN